MGKRRRRSRHKRDKLMRFTNKPRDWREATACCCRTTTCLEPWWRSDVANHESVQRLCGANQRHSLVYSRRAISNCETSNERTWPQEEEEEEKFRSSNCWRATDGTTLGAIVGPDRIAAQHAHTRCRLLLFTVERSFRPSGSVSLVFFFLFLQVKHTQ